MVATNPSRQHSAGTENGDAGWYVITPGEHARIRTSAIDTNAVYTMLEIVAEPRNGVPMHVHANEEEHFVILEGTLHFARGDTRLDAPAGSTVTIPRGVAHAWCNLSDVPARMLIVFSPGHIEDMFRAIMEGVPQEEVAAIAEGFGTAMIGPALRDDVFSILSPRPAGSQPRG